MEELKALIVDMPHIDNILSGWKTWEMRSVRTKKRELIGLIKKGSGTVIGVVEIIDSLGPFSKDEMLTYELKHRMTPERLNEPDASKYDHAWVLKNARFLKLPVRYDHPSGAQSWVKLDAQTSAAVWDAMV